MLVKTDVDILWEAWEKYAINCKKKISEVDDSAIQFVEALKNLDEALRMLDETWHNYSEKCYEEDPEWFEMWTECLVDMYESYFYMVDMLSDE